MCPCRQHIVPHSGYCHAIQMCPCRQHIVLILVTAMPYKCAQTACRGHFRKNTVLQCLFWYESKLQYRW